MASHNLFNFLVFAFVLATVSSSPVREGELAIGRQSNHMIVGEREYNDKLVYQESIGISASLVGKKVIHEQTFNALPNHIITEVIALDQMNDGTGATVYVTKGGPGQDSVTLRFKSQRFHGIYYNVQVFAKPRV